MVAQRLRDGGTSSSGVRVTETLEAGLGGAGARVGEGKLSIELAEEGSFLFRAAGCSVAEIEDRAALGRAILDQGGMWDKDWNVVDAVVRAASCTIVVCNSGTAAVTLGAKGPVQLSGIADAEAGLSITTKSGDVLSFLAAKGLTPLFKLSRVKHSWVQKLVGAAPTFGGASPSASMPASDDENPLEAVEPE